MVADNYEDLVKCGYLEMKLPRKHRKFGRQAWKQKWFILRRKSFQGGPTRLEYHRSEEACLTCQNKTVVDLQTLVKIEPACKSRSRKITFKLVFRDTFCITLGADSEKNMKEWIKLIKKFVLPDPEPSLLQSQTEEGSFPVTVINTTDSERLKLIGEYKLVITLEHLILYSTSDDGFSFSGSFDILGSEGSSLGEERSRQSQQEPSATWHLDDIPRFRLQKLNHLNDAEKIFIINLARTNQSAEIEIQFLTQNGREILETVKSKTRQRSRTIDESPSSTPQLDHPNDANEENTQQTENESQQRVDSTRNIPLTFNVEDLNHRTHSTSSEKSHSLSSSQPEADGKNEESERLVERNSEHSDSVSLL